MMDQTALKARSLLHLISVMAVLCILNAQVLHAMSDQQSELAGVNEEISQLQSEVKNQERVIGAMRSMSAWQCRGASGSWWVEMVIRTSVPQIGRR